MKHASVRRPFPPEDDHIVISGSPLEGPRVFAEQVLGREPINGSADERDVRLDALHGVAQHSLAVAREGQIA